MEDLPYSIVIDHGSDTTKVGFGGDDCPRTRIPTLVEPFNPIEDIESTILNWENQKEHIEMVQKPPTDLICPIELGIIIDWEAMETIWHCCFNELGVSSETFPVLLTEPCANPKPNREKMTHIMFEKFNIPSLNVTNTSCLSLFASGRINGVSVESGHNMTYSVPIYDGYCINSSIKTMNLAGRNLTDYMVRLLKEADINLSSFDETKIARDIKEKFCYISDDSSTESRVEAEKVEYELPDGQAITISNERFKCPEILFQPNTYQNEDTIGLHDLIFQSIIASDVEIRFDLYKNIILTGGNTLIKGIKDRLSRELNPLVSSVMQCKIIDRPQREMASWVGGSILSSLIAFQTLLITKADYEENGPIIVNKKCPQ